MIDAILRMNIVDSPFVGVVYTLRLGALLCSWRCGEQPDAGSSRARLHS